MSIAGGLAAVGVPVKRIDQASLDARGSTPYFADARDGRRLFVKALGRDERSADLLFRFYRWLVPRDLGDEKGYRSLRRAVEHEALVALAAADLGVRTPRFVSLATAEPNSFVLVYEGIDGKSSTASRRTRSTTSCSGHLGPGPHAAERRLAHRDLRLANVFVAADGAVWMIDFGFSELAASDTLLANDVAELLAATSLHRGRRSGGRGRRGRDRARGHRQRPAPAPAVGAERRHSHRAQGTVRPPGRAADAGAVAGSGLTGGYPPAVSTQGTAPATSGAPGPGPRPAESFGYFGRIGAQLSTVVTIASGVAYVMGVLVTDSYWRRLGNEPGGGRDADGRPHRHLRRHRDRGGGDRLRGREHPGPARLGRPPGPLPLAAVAVGQCGGAGDRGRAAVRRLAPGHVLDDRHHGRHRPGRPAGGPLPRATRAGRTWCSSPPCPC
jgi:hypothetical protein